MSQPSRILSALMIALLGLSTVTDEAPKARSDTIRRVVVVGATDRDRTELGWALDRFDQANLDLPPMTIEFHTDRDGCDGAAGVHRVGRRPAHIDVCVSNRLLIVHELAHAWDHHSLEDGARRAFMELRGLTVWNDHDVAWKDRGVEALAEIITWGLNGTEVDAASDDEFEKAMAYELVTGSSPLRGSGRVIAASPGVVQDPAMADPDWDDLR